MSQKKIKPDEYLKKSYLRILIPDEESGAFTAEIMEFPGCIAEGDTPQEAYERLENVAKSWLEAALDLGQEIPPPSLVHDSGGRFALRLPKSLHRQASLVAHREGISLNQFIVTALSEKLGALNLYNNLSEKLIQHFEKLELQQQAYQTAVNDAVRFFSNLTWQKQSGSDVLVAGVNYIPNQVRRC